MYIYLLESNSFLSIVHVYSHAFTYSSLLMMQAVLVISTITIYILIGFASFLFVPNLRRNWANWKWGNRYKPGSTREKHIVICGNIPFKPLAGWLVVVWLANL